MKDDRDDLDRVTLRRASPGASWLARMRAGVALLGTRALVADDDAPFADVVGECLPLAGARVHLALNGLELVERLVLDGPYDFVVADVCMPWLNGLHAIGRARFFGRHVPVLFLSGCTDPELPAWVASLGAQASLLHKPFEPRTLLLAVASLLVGR